MGNLKLSERFMFYSGLLVSMAVTVGAEVFPEDLKHISDLLDAEERGLLLKLPCKVGDTVYKIYDAVYEFIVMTIYLNSENTIVIVIESRELNLGVSIGVDDFGKYVFATKAEAEKKLAEMEK